MKRKKQGKHIKENTEKSTKDKLATKEHSKKESLFNIPNTITLMRLVILPFLLFFIGIGWKYPAFGLFVFIALLDKLDGYLANRLKQATKFGRGFDAAVDSTTILLVLLFLAFFNYVAWYQFGILIFFGVITFLIQSYFVSHGEEIIHSEFARYTTLFTYFYIGGAFILPKMYVLIMFAIVAFFSLVRCIQYMLAFNKLVEKNHNQK